MLGDAARRRRRSRPALAELPAGTPVVVDPVMVAESGARLIEPDAERWLVEHILPRATVVTPNLPEARVLAGRPAARARSSRRSRAARSRAVLALGPGERWSSPAGTATQPPTCCSPRGDAAGRGDRGRAPPGRRRPRLGLHPFGRARRAARARARACRRRPGSRAPAPGRRSPTGCTTSASGAGPVDVIGLCAAARTVRAGEAVCHNPRWR